MSGLSLSGFVLFFGLAGGAWLGVLLARWRVKREVSKGILNSFAVRAGKTIAPAKPRSIWRQPILALIFLIIVLAIVELFVTGGHTNIAVYLLFGVGFGVVLERTGFCMTASFRDLFTSGGGRLARGSIVAIATAMIGFTILVATGTRQPFVLPVGWHTLVGGLLFGFGMVLAGGCASGTLFRVGEGNAQYMMALLGAILSAPLFSKFLTDIHFKQGAGISLITELGVQAALWIGIAFLLIWLLVVQWNEMRSKK